MANIFDYLKWRKDVPFTVSPFNEVDSLVLTELIYADFEGSMPENGERVTIEEARERFWKLHTPEEIMAEDSFTKMAPFLMDDMVNNARFGGTEMSWFYSVIDTEADVQLAAVTFWLPDGTAFVAFRGTDSTIVGWKEDFYLSFLPETEGQRRAKAYLNEHFANDPIPLRIGGHSKGGNMAIYAAVTALPEIRERIMAVYNNDGPGFLEAFTQTEAYREMLPRIICTVPEDSIIGTLLTNEAYQHVVKSTAVSILQHDGFTWQVLGSGFVEAEKRSESSFFIETTLREWLGTLNEEDRKVFVNSLFSLFEATGASTFTQIKQDMTHSLSNMKKMLDAMPKEQREAMWGSLSKLLKTGGGNAVQETKKALLAKLESFTATLEREKKQENLDA